jgi:hypothetical protein
MEQENGPVDAVEYLLCKPAPNQFSNPAKAVRAQDQEVRIEGPDGREYGIAGAVLVGFEDAGSDIKTVPAKIAHQCLDIFTPRRVALRTLHRA